MRAVGPDLPILRIEIDSMRQGIRSILDTRHQELIACVNAGIDAAIKALPAQIAEDALSISESVVREALREAIDTYWKSGAGRQQLDALIHARLGGGT